VSADLSDYVCHAIADVTRTPFQMSLKFFKVDLYFVDQSAFFKVVVASTV